MRDINQKASDTDKQITITPNTSTPPIPLRRSVRLSDRLTLRAISTSGLSVVAIAAAFLGMKPAQANVTEPSAGLPNPTFSEEQASVTAQAETSDPQSELQASSTHEDAAPELSMSQFKEDSGALLSLPQSQDASPALPIANSLSSISVQTTTPNFSTQAEVTPKPTPTVLPGFVPPSTELELTQTAVEPQVPQSLAEKEPTTTIHPGTQAGGTAFSRTPDALEYKVLDSSTGRGQPTTIMPSFALQAEPAPIPTALQAQAPQPEAKGRQLTTMVPSWALPEESASLANPAQPSVPPSMQVAQATAPEPYSGPGAAELLGGTIQAQSSIDAAQEAQSENAAQTNNPLAPSLTFQGGFITQGETGARARVTGLYPVSPNLLFGGTVDLTTGEGFSDSPGTGLDLSELYVTTSLPSYPNLRLTAGLVDLTSYFDRNSFAKDSLTHFFNPVFQTNPALARSGIASRPAVLLNWDISDNFQARAAGFSSSRSPSELTLDAFAGELAFRAGNGIIRGTYVNARDNGRDGFEEVFGIPRGINEFGPRSSDRESAVGINAEYYIPEIKMGLFGRYGHYENTSIGEGGDTYSVGLNFLDLFMKDDRLGFGYGRDLSNDSLRRASRNKVPDVWEVFYDFRLTSYLRAGVTLQARDEFSDIVAGVRVKTEFDLLNLGRAFR
jgi:hypothetical protein